MRRPEYLVAFALCVLCTRAASLETTFRSTALSLTRSPDGVAISPLLTVGCQGLTSFAGFPPRVATSPENAIWDRTRFTGADPGCRLRPGPSLPGTRNYYAAGVRQEGESRWSQVTLAGVWPGVDVTVSVENRQARLAFEVADAARVGDIRLVLPAEAFSLEVIPYFGRAIRATARAEELTPVGAVAIPLEVRRGESAPFRLLRPASNPVRIVLEAVQPSAPAAPTAFVRDAAGNQYEAIGPAIRKYAPNGALLFETELAGADNTELVAGPEGSIYAIGKTLSAQFPTTPGAAQTKFGGVYVFVTPRGNVYYGDATVTRLDGATGRVIFSTYLGGAFTDTVNFRSLDSAGNLDLYAVSNSADFPVKGSPIGAGCTPRSPFISIGLGFGDIGISCSFQVRLSPEGSLLASRPLPRDTVSAYPGGDGKLYVLQQRAVTLSGVTVYDLAGKPVPEASFPMPPGQQSYPASLAVDSLGGVWITSMTGLFHRPPGAAAVRRVPGVGFTGSLFPIAGGGVIAAAADFQASGAPELPGNALMSKSCAAAAVIIDGGGAVRYATYVPDSLQSPSPSAPATLDGRALLWERHRLDFDAPPRAPQFCRGNYVASPGSLLRFSVRGVPDASPFRASLRPGDALPASVRGLSVRINGVLTGIVELDGEWLTVAVPADVPISQQDGEADLSITLDGRPITPGPYSALYLDTRFDLYPLQLYLAPANLSILRGTLAGFNYTITGASPAVPGGEIRLFVTGVGPVINGDTPALPYTASTYAGQSVAITYFQQAPGHPPGVFELRLRLPDAANPPKFIYLSTPSIPFTTVIDF